MATRNPFCVRRVPQEWSEWIDFLTPVLDSRCAWRLPVVLSGLLLARGRRTVTSWLRAQGVLHDFQDYSYFLGSLGRKTEPLATCVFQLLLSRLPLPDRIVLALDDTPTRRYGPQVEGAGLHHNPTSGPDDHKFIYGHIWVTLAWVVRHPSWHAIGLPLRALMYIKAKGLPDLAERCGWRFRTKLELAAELVKWAETIVKKPLWIVADGAYAYRPLLREILPLGVTFVGRPRRCARCRRRGGLGSAAAGGSMAKKRSRWPSARRIARAGNRSRWRCTAVVA